MEGNLHAGIVLAVVMLTVCMGVFFLVKRLVQPVLERRSPVSLF